MKPTILISAALALPTLSASAPVAAQWSAKPYRAIGTEPFWSLVIGPRTITYRPVEGRGMTVAKPRATKAGRGTIYRARGMTVAIRPLKCSDGMSDHTYSDTVQVTIGSRVLSGCGGTVIAREGRARQIT